VGQADWPRVNPTQGNKGQEVYEQYKNVVPNICTAQAMSCTITKLFCLTSMACHPLVVYSDLTGMGVADATENDVLYNCKSNVNNDPLD